MVHACAYFSFNNGIATNNLATIMVFFIGASISMRPIFHCW